MTAPAGPCEWCGGPQFWTIASGVMYVKCQGGCTSLFPEERFNFPPPNSEKSEILEREFHEGGTLGTEEGVTPLGREAEESEHDLPF